MLALELPFNLGAPGDCLLDVHLSTIAHFAHDLVNTGLASISADATVSLMRNSTLVAPIVAPLPRALR